MKHFLLAASIATALTPVVSVTYTKPAHAYFALEATQQSHMLMQKIEMGLRYAELVKSNENWLVELMRMDSSIAGPLMRDFRVMLENMRQAQFEAKEIVLDPNGSGEYEAHRLFRIKQLDRDLAYLENVSIRMDAVANDSERSSRALTGLVESNRTAEGGVQSQQIGNEIAAVNARKQEQILATLQDILLSMNADRALRAEEKLLSEERHCVMYPDECS